MNPACLGSWIPGLRSETWGTRRSRLCQQMFGFVDPRSQERDLGHPSITVVPADVWVRGSQVSEARPGAPVDHGCASRCLGSWIPTHDPIKPRSWMGHPATCGGADGDHPTDEDLSPFPAKHGPFCGGPIPLGTPGACAPLGLWISTQIFMDSEHEKSPA